MGGGGASFSHPEAGDATSFGEVLTRVLEVLTILEGGGGGHKQFPPFKKKRGGEVKRFTLS